ncbi:HAAS signaling domain-containing protein [Dyadobacter psychrotolerans]|uniref:DUF1700 domain-containing protein n=1 Tax=Dyadobacter psychrotolerans TaxID=2541721 RepID=A0A4V2Z443_9BACT|nr:DUF1700 domain-containing protein [Dyadobacter psychrotolerans]TDE15188.1 hypothetical protein E0F88_11730 [Dyadobacter psychrotolerans]
MKSITLENKSAQRIYNDYIHRCKKAVKILPQNDQQDCLLEINSHIFEYLSAEKGDDQTEALLNVLARLGPPEEMLKELVATKKVEQAKRTFNPVHLLEAIFLNLSNGFIYIILFFLFVIEISLPVLIVLELIYPERIGFFTNKHGGFYLGYGPEESGSREWLGNAVIPFMLVMIAVIYAFMILLLRITKTTKKILQ